MSLGIHVIKHKKGETRSNLQLLPASLNVKKGKDINFILPDCYKMPLNS